MFGSLEALKKEEEEKKKNDQSKPTTESYTGGEKSGMAVYNPASPDELKAAGVARDGAPPEGSANVELYKDGFVLNGGPLRAFTDPLNRKFIDDLMAGVQPEELGSKDNVHVSFTDRRQETYKEPGAMGIRIGPRTTAQAASVSEGAVTGPVASGTGEVSVDDSKPTTTIQIRYGDGTRKAQKFNESHSVGDLYNFVSQVTGSTDFTINGGFPPKPLTDKSATIKDAGLLQAQVMVKQA